MRAANLDIAVDRCPAGRGADTILLPAGIYPLSIRGGENAALSGDLDLTSTLTISGAGATTTIINGSDHDRVFDVQSAASVTINAITIRNGRGVESAGGGIANAGALTLNSSTVSNNLVDGLDHSSSQ